MANFLRAQSELTLREKWNAWGGWRLAAGLGLAVVLLYLAFRQANWAEMLAVARQARPEYLALALLWASLSWMVRSLRWRILLSAEKSIPPRTVFWAIAAGYLGNYLLPARAGELIRSVLLGEKAHISKSYVLATVLTERIIDACVLALICLATLRRLGTPAPWMTPALNSMLGLGVGGLAFLFIAPRLENLLVTALARLPLPPALRSTLTDFTRRFLLGARAFQHPGRALGFAALTGVIWLSDALLIGLEASAFGLHLALPNALLLLSVLGLASAAPSTPGYLGIYQFVAVTILVPLGFTRNEALIYIVAVQAINYVVGLVWGPLGLWRLGATGLQPSRP